MASVAVRMDGNAFQYVQVEWREDAFLERQAVSQNGFVLAQLPGMMKRNKDVVMAAVNQGGKALYCASWERKDDPDVVLAAVMQDGSALH